MPAQNNARSSSVIASSSEFHLNCLEHGDIIVAVLFEHMADSNAVCTQPMQYRSGESCTAYLTHTTACCELAYLPWQQSQDQDGEDCSHR